MTPLRGLRVLTMAVNVPGPAAAARLVQLGASVVKVEPPGGDPLATLCPAWYVALCVGQEVLRLDLKTETGTDELAALLTTTDLLLTANRPAALARLGLAWPRLHARYPRLVQVAIVGYPAPAGDAPGHDLTYLAGVGLLAPPRLPVTLLADLGGAELAVSAALGLLLARERGQGSGYREVALADAARHFAAPLRYGVTAPDGILGGGSLGYNLYRASDGWVAVAALEPHFWQRLTMELGLSGASSDDLARAFAGDTATAWEDWAAAHGLPLVAVRDVLPARSGGREQGGG